MTKAEKEMAEFVGQWADKITKLATNYEKAIGQLAKLQDDYKKSWKAVLSPILPVIATTAFVIIVFLGLQFMPCYTSFKALGVEVNRDCPKDAEKNITNSPVTEKPPPAKTP